MFGDIMQPTHLLLVLVVALLVLGPKRLPEVGRQLGKGMRDFRAAISGEETERRADSSANQGHISETHQTQSQQVEHQFAHETAESTTDAGSQAEGVTSEPVANDHEFSHEPTIQVGAPEDHSATPERPSDAGADKPVDPLA
jgi:sec-independent protein translocase protein TatA